MMNPWVFSVLISLGVYLYIGSILVALIAINHWSFVAEGKKWWNTRLFASWLFGWPIMLAKEFIQLYRDIKG